MPLTRRQLLSQSVGLAAAFASRGRVLATPASSLLSRTVVQAGIRPGTPQKAPLHPDTLAHFVDALPIPKVAQPLDTKPDPTNPNKRLDYYRLTMGEVEVQVHALLELRCFSPRPHLRYHQ